MADLSSYRFQLLTVPFSEAALAELHEAGTLGIEERNDLLVAWFPEDASLDDLRLRLAGRLETIDSEDWSEKWRENIRPVRVGPLVVVPPWLMDEALPDERLIIDPGMAFGTGDHATTRGCIACLVRAVTPGARVLDFGCGSGILAIAAMKLGAAEATAVDCDPKAAELAAENARVNGVAIEARTGETPPAGLFDIVVANIQSSVLFPLLPDLKARVRPGGWLILAGLLADEETPFPDPDARIVETGWQTIAWRKEDPSATETA